MPVSKVDRITFVSLLSVSLLHALRLLVEINCGHSFGRIRYLPSKSTHKVEHANGYQEIGECARTHINLVAVDKRDKCGRQKRKYTRNTDPAEVLPRDL